LQEVTEEGENALDQNGNQPVRTGRERVVAGIKILKLWKKGWEKKMSGNKKGRLCGRRPWGVTVEPNEIHGQAREGRLNQAPAAPI